MAKSTPRMRINRFNKSITKRGQKKLENTDESSTPRVGALVLGLFVFLVAGSALFEILSTLTSNASPF